MGKFLELAAGMPLDQVRELVESMPLEEKLAACSDTFDWTSWARPEQLWPEGDWRTWVVMSGRGWGKTLTGAQNSHRKAKAGGQRIALVGRTHGDLRDVMIEGPSGLLAEKCIPAFEKPLYEPSKRRLTWPRPRVRIAAAAGQIVAGAEPSVATTFTGEKPDQLRGPEFSLAWCDELAAWKYLHDCWSNLKLALRVEVGGEQPRTIVTTTPRPLLFLRNLIKRERTVVTGGATYENAANLPGDYLVEIDDLYGGTSLGRQEIFGEILEEAEGALWQREWIDAHRVPECPDDLSAVYVGVDPAVSSGEQSSETGIVTVGRKEFRRKVDGKTRTVSHFYVLDDRSVRGKPDKWAENVLGSFDTWFADLIIGEGNNGGEMVAHTIRTARPSLPVRVINASHGKAARAQPIALLYEQGRVHHVGPFGQLEDQLCLVPGTLITTNRGDVPIEAVERGDMVATRDGWAPVRWSGCTGFAGKMTRLYSGNRSLVCTPGHPIWTETRGFVAAGTVDSSDHLLALHSPGGSAIRSHGGVAGITECPVGTIATPAESFCIEQSGKRTAGKFQPTCSFTIETATRETIDYGIFASLAARNIVTHTPEDGLSPSAVSMARRCGATGRENRRRSGFANAAEQSICRTQRGRSSALGDVGAGPVYNLSVESGYLPEFFANGILVHNCNWEPDSGLRSPDRLDALVWAIEWLRRTQRRVRRLGNIGAPDRRSTFKV